MKGNKYYILVTEGITDCSLLEAILEKYLEFEPYKNINELPDLFKQMVGIYPTKTGELKREDSPTFYYRDSIAVAIKQANGYSNIATKISLLIEVIDQLDIYEQFGGFLIFCDTDLKNANEIKNIFQSKFEENEILYENDCLIAYSNQVRCYLHTFPINGCGAVERLLLDCAAVSYEELTKEAMLYRNRIMIPEYRSVRNECWTSDSVIQEFYADKVQFGALSAVLKPDRPVRFSIKDKIIRNKYFNEYMKLPEFNALYNFLDLYLV